MARKRRKKLKYPSGGGSGITRYLLYFLIAAFISFVVWKCQTAKPAGKPAAKPAAVQKVPAKSPERPPVPVVPVRETTPPPVRVRPEATGPALVFVIDDIGYHLEFEDEMRSLGDKVTYAVLPMLPYSEHFGRVGKEMNAEVILHLPLEALDGTIPGRGLITVQMPDEQILEVLDHDLASVPFHSGANNHMGSLGTSDPRVMEVILQNMKQRGLFFLDSGTSPKSVAPEVARRIGLPVLIRDVFLDNVDDKEAVRRQIYEMEEIARVQGHAIGIGHYRANTLEAIREEIPRLESMGFRIVSLRDLIRERYR